MPALVPGSPDGVLWENSDELKQHCCPHQQLQHRFSDTVTSNRVNGVSASATLDPYGLFLHYVPSVSRMDQSSQHFEQDNHY